MLLRIEDQGVQAASYGRGRGVMASCDDGHAICQRFRFTDRRFVDGSRGDHAQQVVARSCPAFGEQQAKVGEELLTRLQRAAIRVLVEGIGVMQAEELPRQAMHQLSIRFGYT